MSAFVMNPKGFNDLAIELATRAEDSNRTCDVNYSITRDVQEFLALSDRAGLTEERVNQAAFDVALALYNVNVSAVCCRYPEMTRESCANAPKFSRVSYWPKWTPIQLLKHLTCLRYQMSEGDIPESPIYARLSKLIADIALSIVTSSPEYNDAAWDFADLVKAA